MKIFTNGCFYHVIRLPKLKGDNWWRGHARAFLKYVNLPADSLRQGRVCQVLVDLNQIFLFYIIYYRIQEPI